MSGQFPPTARGPLLRSTHLLALVSILAIVGCGGEESRSGPPEYTTNIYVADIVDRDGLVELTRISEVTQRDGYDNQPTFLSDGRTLLYCSRRGEQVDIFRYDFDTGTSKPLVETPEREYLPSAIPGDDGFSTVRVERNGDHRLWRFDLDGGEGRPLLQTRFLLRYYLWVGPKTIYAVDAYQRPNLRLVDIEGGSDEAILNGVGRSLHRIPGRDAISFVHKVGADEWWIKELDLETNEVRPLVLTRPGSEDMAWTPGGLILMGQGSRIFQWKPGPGAGWEDWQLVVDLTLQGLLGVTRMTVSPDGPSSSS